MQCKMGDLVHAYVDGELDAAGAAELESHVAGCEPCQARLEEIEVLRTSMQSAQLYVKAPPRVREGVRASYGVRRPRFDRARGLVAAAAAVCAVVLAVVVSRGADATRDVEVLIDAHLRAVQPGHGVDVVSTDQHAVKPWFDGKLDFSPPVREVEGYPMVGGRLDALHGRTVAAIVYNRRKHVIDLFAWPGAAGDASPRSGSWHGYQWVSWRVRGMELRLVSDIAMEDLTALQQLLAQ